MAEVHRLHGSQVVACKSPEEAISWRGADAAFIGSPDEDHPAQLLLAVQAGKHVLCEKPLAVDEAGLALVDRALQEAEAKGLVVASCHPRRAQVEDLAYGWLKYRFSELAEQFGELWEIDFTSDYPVPSGWKSDRSFMADKVVHDIDFVRHLLGEVTLDLRCLMDSADHYKVRGSVGAVELTFNGTRLHTADNDYVEIVLLGFKHGTCAVYSKTGLVRYWDRRTGNRWEHNLSPMNSEGYDRVFASLTQGFVDAVRSGTNPYSYQDLWVNTAAVVGLAGLEARFRLIV